MKSEDKREVNPAQHQLEQPGQEKLMVPPPQAEAKDKPTRALSRSEFQRGFVSGCRRASSSNENCSRQQSSMASNSREGIVYRHRGLWRNRNRKDKLLYAAIC